MMGPPTLEELGIHHKPLLEFWTLEIIGKKCDIVPFAMDLSGGLIPVRKANFRFEPSLFMSSGVGKTTLCDLVFALS